MRQGVADKNASFEDPERQAVPGGRGAAPGVNGTSAGPTSRPGRPFPHAERDLTDTFRHMDFTGIAHSFVQHYYTTFDGGTSVRANLAALYRPESMLTWESAQLQGQQNIIAQLTKAELAVVKHQVQSSDAQPAPGGGVLVLVTGSLAVDNAYDKPMTFTETFNLQPIPGQAGGFFVYNQVFRLIFG